MLVLAGVVLGMAYLACGCITAALVLRWDDTLLRDAGFEGLTVLFWPACAAAALFAGALRLLSQGVSFAFRRIAPADDRLPTHDDPRL